MKKHTPPPRRPKHTRLEEDVALLLKSTNKILALLHAPRVHLELGICEQPHPSVGDPHIMLNLTATQQATLTLVFTPAKAKPDGVPEWATSDPAIASVEPSTDGLSAIVKATGLGVAAVSVTGDKKHGAEVVSFVGSIDVQVNEADVESVAIVAGEPSEQA